MACRECNSENTSPIGQTCRQAIDSGELTIQRNADGTVYGEVGLHYRGYECHDCGHEDAEPCVHD